MATNKHIIDVQTKGAKKSEKQIKGVSGALGSMAKSAALAAGAYFGGRMLLNGIKQSIDLFAKQELAEKKLEAALGKTSNMLLNQAKALQQVTMFGDEQIIEAQALIGSFVEEESAIAAATKATLDLAAAKGMELTVAADLVSKTLGSSTNALSRYGIEVTGAVGSTERLESLTGNLANVFGGQALQQTNTMTGALAQMSNAVGDAQEALGKTLQPAVTAIAGKMKAAAEAFQGWVQATTESGVERTIREIKELGGDTTQLELALNKIQQSEALATLGGKSRDVKDIQKEIKEEMEAQNKSSTDRMSLEQEILKHTKDEISLQDLINLSIANSTSRQKDALTIELERLQNKREEFELDHEKHDEKITQLNEEMEATNKLNMLKLGADVLSGKAKADELTAEQNKQALEKKGIEFLKKEKAKALSKNFQSDQIEAINNAWDMAGHAYSYGAKTGGPFLGGLYGATALSAGLAYAKNIKAAQYGADFVTDGPQMMLVGEGSGPERVQVTPLADPNLDGPQGGGVNVTFNNPIMTQDFVENQLMDNIKESLRLGGDIGIN